MADKQAPTAKPVGRILVTNDDGARAEGLKVMEQLARELSDDVWVVSPETDQSGVSHSVSLHRPLRLYSWDERHHAVSGTPSDCVLLALGHLMADRPPDLILSGVNRGANLSDTVAYSGTVGAAMTGLLLDIPSMALSQAFRDPDNVRWGTAAELGPGLVRDLLERGWPSGCCLNINFPDEPVDGVTGIGVCRPARGAIGGVKVEARRDTREQPYYWLGFRRGTSRVRDPDSDVDTLRRGRIAVSPLYFERAIDAQWKDLEEDLNKVLAGV